MRLEIVAAAIYSSVAGLKRAAPNGSAISARPCSLFGARPLSPSKRRNCSHPDDVCSSSALVPLPDSIASPPPATLMPTRLEVRRPPLSFDLVACCAACYSPAYNLTAILSPSKSAHICKMSLDYCWAASLHRAIEWTPLTAFRLFLRAQDGGADRRPFAALGVAAPMLGRLLGLDFFPHPRMDGPMQPARIDRRLARSEFAALDRLGTSTTSEQPLLFLLRARMDPMRLLRIIPRPRNASAPFSALLIDSISS